MLALIADDDRTIRLLLKRLLERMGLEVIAAEDGSGLLGLLDVHQPLFVVIDIEMPVINGIEALRVIRSAERFRDLPVVCVSANTDPKTVREMINLGVTDYLLKPFDIERVAARLRSAMSAALARPQGTRIATAESQAVLVADADHNLGETIRQLLGTENTVITVDTGVAALSACRDGAAMPDAVIVGDGLGLLGGHLLANAIRRLAAERAKARPRLIRVGGALPPEQAREFDGQLPRASLAEGLSRLLGLEGLSAEAVDAFLARKLSTPDLVVAVAAVVEGRLGWTRDMTGRAEDSTVWSSVRLSSAAPDASIEVTIGGAEGPITRLPDPASGTYDDGAEPRVAAERVLLAVAGAIRDLAARWGLDLTLGTTAEGGSATPATTAFQFAGPPEGGRFWLQVGLPPRSPAELATPADAIRDALSFDDGASDRRG